MADDRESVIRGFRALADFLEQHPDVPAPYCSTQNVFAKDKEEVARCARTSTWEKDYSQDWFMLRKDFGGSVTLEINISRSEVCRRVVTGTQVIPASPERTVDVVEWVCEESILSPAAV